MTARQAAAEATRLERRGQHRAAAALWEEARILSGPSTPPEVRRDRADEWAEQARVDTRRGRHYWRPSDDGELVHRDRAGEIVARAHRRELGGVMLTYPGRPALLVSLKMAEREAEKRIKDARAASR